MNDHSHQCRDCGGTIPCDLASDECVNIPNGGVCDTCDGVPVPDDHPDARWMVVDRDRTPIVTGLFSRSDADEEASDLADPTNMFGGHGPYRVVRDLVSEDA